MIRRPLVHHHLPTPAPADGTRDRPRALRPWTAALTAAIVILIGSAAFADLLDFDEVPAGTLLNEHYAYMGVHMSAYGTGLDSVIAAPPCETVVSPPNALSYQPLGECPGAQDELGWFVVDFDQAQNRVAITVVHRGPNSSAYLKAFSPDGFFDVVWSVPGEDMVGVPQTLVLQPPPDRPRITRVEFGVYRAGDQAYFDDLQLDVIVDSAAAGWSTWKAAWAP